MNVTDQTIADTFVRLLREALTPEQFIEMQDRNFTEALDSVCHSHDFCDANMVMLAAFEAHGFTVNVDDDDQRARWGRAWNLAMPALTASRGVTLRERLTGEMMADPDGTLAAIALLESKMDEVDAAGDEDTADLLQRACEHLWRDTEGGARWYL